MGPYVRIGLRYGVGYLLGSEVGELLAADDELVMIIGLAAGAAIEGAYAFAKRKGWAT